MTEVPNFIPEEAKEHGNIKYLWRIFANLNDQDTEAINNSIKYQLKELWIYPDKLNNLNA